MTVVWHFGMANCHICMHEKFEILHHSFNLDVTLMNNQSGIHGSCRHKPHFHRFSADEPIEGEKVQPCMSIS